MTPTNKAKRSLIRNIASVALAFILSAPAAFALTNFPTDLDQTVTFGTAAHGQPILKETINNLRDAVIAIETKVGKNSSAVTSTLDYILKNSASVNPGHQHTGSALSALNASTITTGTLADARLSSNIPLKNATNTFSALQTFGAGATVTGTVTATSFSGSGASLTGIPETAISDGSLLARVAGNETISGTWSFSNGFSVTGTVTATGFSGNGASLTNLSASALPTGIDAAKIANGNVSNAEYQFLDGVTSAIQTQIDNHDHNTIYFTKTELNTSDGNAPNTGSNRVSWDNLTNVPSDILDGDQLGGGGDAYSGALGDSGTCAASGASSLLFQGDGIVTTVCTNGATDALQFAIANDSITALKIAGDAVGAAELAASAIQSGDIDATDLPTAIDAAKIANGNVSNTEYQHLDGVTSAIQTQIAGKANTSHNHNEVDINDGSILARVASNETISGIWSFTTGVLTLRGVSYLWPVANAPGILTNDGSGNLSWSSEPFCGDGRIDAGETCDGATVPANCTCNQDCSCTFTTTCGNGIKETGEFCDPPGSIGINGCAAGNVCNAGCGSCSAVVCGDGVVTNPEICDKPFTQSTCAGGQLCSWDCLSCTSACGDGDDNDAGEQCDPGDRYAVPSDEDPFPDEQNCLGRCQPNCQCPTPVCGNGFLDLLTGEKCDTGPAPESEISRMSCSPANCRCLADGRGLCNCGPSPLGTNTCGDGLNQQDCAGLADSELGDDEECDSAAPAEDFQTAVRFGQATCAEGTDCGILSSGLDTPFDMVGNEDMVISTFVRVDDFTGNPARIIYKGGQSSTAGQWYFGVQSDGSWRFNIDDTQINSGCTDPGIPWACCSGAGTGTCGNTACKGKTTANGGPQAGHFYHVVFTLSNGTCHFYQMDLSQNPPQTVHTDVTLSSDTTIGTTWDTNNTILALGGRPSNIGTDQFNGLLEETKIYIQPNGSGFVANYISNRMANEWKTEAQQPCSLDPTLTARWSYDGATMTDCVSSTALTQAEAGWAQLTSPATALVASALGTGGGGGATCISGETCNGNCQCQPDDPGGGGQPPTGRVIYIGATDSSPVGNNNNDGLTASTPVLSWSTAFSKVQSEGDTVVALDGTYTFANNGGFVYSCISSTDPPAGVATCTAGRPCGTQTQPITIKAKNNHKAWIKDDGNHFGIRSTGCSWIVFDGFRVTSANDVSPSQTNPHNVWIQSGHNIMVRGMLVTTNNADGLNAHLIRFDNCKNAMTEFNELYDYSRHAISVRDTDGGRHGPNYCNDRSRDTDQSLDPGGIDNFFTHGDECVSIYDTSNSFVENNIGEGTTGGIQMHGGDNSMSTTPGGSNNKISGNIMLGSHLSYYLDPRNGDDPTDANTFTDNVAGDSSPSGVEQRAAFLLRTPTNIVVQNVTILDAGDSAPDGDGLLASEASSTPCSAFGGCTWSAKNTISVNSADANFQTSGPTTNCTLDQIIGAESTGCTNTGTEPQGSTITGIGRGNNQTPVFVSSNATDAYGNGVDLAATKICHGGTNAYKPCASAEDCGGGGTCESDIGANILMRYHNGQRTWNGGCTGAGIPWPCCGAAAPSALNHCEMWAVNDLDCGGADCTTQGTNCDASDVTAVGTANMPNCLHHFVACGAIVTGCTGDVANGCNNVDGDSCMDVHEILHLGQRSPGTTDIDFFPGTYPQ